MATTPNLVKAQALIRAMSDNLMKRLPGYTITQSFDSVGARLTITAGASWDTNTDAVYIRICGDNTQFTDIIGNPQTVYSPLIAQIISELSTGGNGQTATSWTTMTNVMAEVLRAIGKTDLFTTPNGTNPTSAALFDSTDTGVASPAVFASEVISDLNWPLSGQ
jgi:hypothetical protein